jgi:hypothetical protein
MWVAYVCAMRSACPQRDAYSDQPMLTPYYALLGAGPILPTAYYLIEEYVLHQAQCAVCAFHVVCYALLIARSAHCCLLHPARFSLPTTHSVLHVESTAQRQPLFDSHRMIHISCCILHIAYCTLHIALRKMQHEYRELVLVCVAR